MSRRNSPRGGASPPRSHARSYSKSVPTRTTPPPSPPPPRAQQPQGRSLFKDMAATAGGVAVGSAVGHAVGAGITGMFSGRDAAGTGGAVSAQSPSHGPCDLEIIQLLECAQREDELSTCQTLSDAFKKCMTKHGYT